MVTPEMCQFVLFGSSIVQLSFSNEGWGANLADIYSRKAQVAVRGYNGWNSRLALQVLDRIFPKDKDADTQPDLVIVYFGGNDATVGHSGFNPHVPLPEYIHNMTKIAVHLKSLSDKTRVIFLSCPPVNEEWVLQVFGQGFVRSNEALRSYSEACLGVCRDTGVKGVDLWTAIQRRDDWKNLCFVDGMHLSSQGSKIVVDEILEVLKDAEWEPSLYWKSMPSEFADIGGEDLRGAAEWSGHRKHWH